MVSVIFILKILSLINSLEELDIGTDEQWILERVGIHSRRTVLSLDYIKETQNLDPRGTAEASMYTHATTGKIAAQTGP